MMIRLLLLCFLFCPALTALAQSAQSSPERLKLTKVKQPNKTDQIAALEQNIVQIETKILFIKNNPLLLREAESAGYLVELGKLKQISKDKLKLLQK